jgi:hypothetical protein
MAIKKKVQKSQPADAPQSTRSDAEKWRLRCEEAEDEVGRLMAALGEAERNLTNERKKGAQNVGSAMSQGQDLELLLSADVNALAELTSGLGMLRELLVTSAKEIDMFLRKEFGAFNPKAAPMFDVKARLLAAAGKKQPPKVPSAAGGRKTLAPKSKSSVPPKRQSSTPMLSAVSLTPRKLSLGTIDISEMAEYLESLRPAAARLSAQPDPFAAQGDPFKIPKGPKLPNIG